MKLSYNLLKKFVPIDISAEELGAVLTERSFEVEGIETFAPAFTGVVTAKVLTVEKHPNADRLRVVTLDAGNQIVGPVVCGAHNFDVGATVALALPGAYIPKNIHSDEHEGFVLEKAKIRDVESQGMICAGFELGLENQPGEGILHLHDGVTLGTDVTTLFPHDYIIEVSLPANRPDLYSHYGVAREIAAVTDTKIIPFKIKLPREKGDIIMQIEAIEDASMYNAAILSGFKRMESPAWLKALLQSLGIRPINAIVDISNYVMIELGQPTHAFDASKVTGGIVVRRAKTGETLETLDHKTRELTEDVTIIADDKGPIGLAGVMGGLASEVTNETHTIILESATFNPASVRKTSRALGLRSDASSRFEKGLYPELAQEGIGRAIQLIIEITGAKLIAYKFVGELGTQRENISFTADSVNNLIGTALSASEIKGYLGRYNILVKGSRGLTATPPIYRNDVVAPEDLADEILKVHGINNIPIVPLNVPRTETTIHTEARFVRNTKELWARLGFTEVQNYSFVSKDEINKFGEEETNYIAIENPLSHDQGFLRKHLDIPMLRNVRDNLKHSDHVTIFEIGKEYHGFENEPLVLQATVASSTLSPELAIAKLKGAVHGFFKLTGIPDINAEPTNSSELAITSRGITLGRLYLVPAKIKRAFDAPHALVTASLLLDKIAPLAHDASFHPFSKFPNVSRDISIEINKDLPWRQVESLIRPISPLIAAVDLFDAPFLSKDKESQKFHTELAEKGLKNLGIRLVFQAPDRTLKDAEITGIYEQIVLKLEQELGAKIR